MKADSTIRPLIVQRADPYIYKHTAGFYYFTASIPAYNGIGWTELGMMQRADGDPYSFTDFSLDATVFEHAGRRYFVWAEKVGGTRGISNLYMAEMESPVKLKTVQVLLSTPDYDWQRVGFWVNEGPAVLKRNGRIYIAYSASSTGACYCTGLLSASDTAVRGRKPASRFSRPTVR